MNTRVRKDGPNDFTLLIASADRNTNVKEETLSINGQTVTLKLEYGDHSEALRRAADALKKAKEYAANDHQASALSCYIQSFETGDVEAHKEASCGVNVADVDQLAHQYHIGVTPLGQGCWAGCRKLHRLHRDLRRSFWWSRRMGRVYRDREQGVEHQVRRYGQPGPGIDQGFALGSGFRSRYLQETRLHCS